MLHCPTCGGILRVYHTFTVKNNAQVRDHRCVECRRNATSVTFLTEGIQTSYSLIRQVEAGEVVLKERREDQPS